MQDIVDYLIEHREQPAWPLELPDDDQLLEVEESLLMPIPRQFRDYLLEFSDTIYGAIEPVTAADTYSHTYIVEVTAQCWHDGMPRTHIAVCRTNAGAWAIDQDGEIHWWPAASDECASEPTYESWWHWVRDVWLDGAL